MITRHGTFARWWVLVLTAALVCTPLLHTFSAAADEAVWAVKGKLLGKQDKKSKDVSGMACASDVGFPRRCLVIDDESQSAQFVTLHDGEIVAGPSVQLINDAFEAKTLELDGEGVAYAHGFFYVIGSHGHPRDKDHQLDPHKDAAKIKAKITASSQVIRIAADSGTDNPTIQRTPRLKGLLVAQDILAPFVDKRLEQATNGVTIEGVAVRENRLFAGFRGPSMHNDQAVILSVTTGALFENEPPDPQLHVLPLGEGRGVRDLARFGKGLLVLAGPTAGEGGQYAIYWWDGSGKTVTLLKNLDEYHEDGEALKAEAIVPLGLTGSGLRVLVLFDGAKEGGPRAIEVAKPPS
jgi:hypothetical protein